MKVISQFFLFICFSMKIHLVVKFKTERKIVVINPHEFKFELLMIRNL